MLGLSLLAVDPPEYRQAKVAVGAAGQTDGQAEHHPVQPEAKHLVPLARQHRVQEEAPAGHLGAALVGQGIVADQPEDAAGDQLGHDDGKEHLAPVVPFSDSGVEDGVDGVVVVVCSPKTGPGGMRVSEALRGQETNHEATQG
jgi:hypothetical protein